MIFYQAVIMAVVVIAIYVLAFILKFKKRKMLVLCVIFLIMAGGVGLYAVQYAFGNHFYTQELDNSSIERVHFTARQQHDISKIFRDYKRISGSGHSAYAIGKTYRVTGYDAKSVIESNIYLFSNSRDAENYFKASQKFYDNKNYIPLDSFNSKNKGNGRHYLISLVKSGYRDYTDLIYLPSKITYSSDLVVEDGNVILQLNEIADKPVSNKQQILDTILNRLNKDR
jgi:hypothetical protein